MDQQTIIDKATHWWRTIEGNNLAQGDYLQDCPVPIIPDAFDPVASVETEFTIDTFNLIILSQSCDLAHDKVKFAVACPVYTLDEIQEVLHEYSKFSAWEPVRRGQVEGWHMISGFSGPDNPASALIVDFRQVYSLPVGFLKKFSKTFESRKRLNSPFLERLSQAFARFFMRVGLPVDIKPFK